MYWYWYFRLIDIFNILLLLLLILLRSLSLLLSSESARVLITMVTYPSTFWVCHTARTRTHISLLNHSGLSHLDLVLNIHQDFLPLGGAQCVTVECVHWTLHSPNASELTRRGVLWRSLPSFSLFCYFSTLLSPDLRFACSTLTERAWGFLGDALGIVRSRATFRRGRHLLCHLPGSDNGSRIYDWLGQSRPRWACTADPCSVLWS